MSWANRKKLIAFVIVTALSVGVLGFQYMGLSRTAGIGVYEVTLRLPDAAGLYPKAEVSYRGVKIGDIQSLEADTSGVTAILVLDDDVKVPADLRAEVRSVSAVGEQYVDLVPQATGTNRGDFLSAGSTITDDRVVLPISSTSLLTNTSKLLASVPTESLATTIDELGTAFDGSSERLGTLLDSASAFQETATANLDPTMALLDDLQTVLSTQDRSSSDTASSVRNLSDLTAVLARRDPEVRGLLTRGGPFFDETDALVDSLKVPLPQLLGDLATTAGVLKTFNPALDDLLTIFPALVAAIPSIIPPEVLDDPIPMGNMNAKLNINDPPSCTQGFADAKKQRSTDDLTPGKTPTDSYCKVAPDDPRVVRGARNIPCVNNPAIRSASVEDCGLSFPRYVVPGFPADLSTVVGIDVARDQGITASGERVPLRSLALSSASPTTWQDLLRPGSRN